jgi:hypothetical protein
VLPSLKTAVERSTLRDENQRLREQAPWPEIMTTGAWSGAERSRSMP